MTLRGISYAAMLLASFVLMKPAFAQDTAGWDKTVAAANEEGALVLDSQPNIEMRKYVQEEWAKAYNGGENANDTPLGRLYVRHSNIRRHMGSILAKAFPNHLDRSDVQSDYFDSKWSVS